MKILIEYKATQVYCVCLIHLFVSCRNIPSFYINSGLMAAVLPHFYPADSPKNRSSQTLHITFPAVLFVSSPTISLGQKLQKNFLWTFLLSTNPKIYTIQQLGLGISKALATHIRNCRTKSSFTNTKTPSTNQENDNDTDTEPSNK